MKSIEEKFFPEIELSEEDKAFNARQAEFREFARLDSLATLNFVDAVSDNQLDATASAITALLLAVRIHLSEESAKALIADFMECLENQLTNNSQSERLHQLLKERLL